MGSMHDRQAKNDKYFATLRDLYAFYCSLRAGGKSCWTSNVCTKFHQQQIINQYTTILSSRSSSMSDSKLKSSGSACSDTDIDGQASVDYYALLGVAKDATKTDVKKALVSFVDIRRHFLQAYTFAHLSHVPADSLY